MAEHGEIIKFSGSWGSGMASLTVKNTETGEVVTLYADSGPLGRALNACYGAAGPGHVINNESLQGKLIYYAVDDMGMLAGFEPAE